MLASCSLGREGLAQSIMASEYRDDDGASAASGGDDGSNEPIHDAMDAFNKATAALDA